MLSIAVALIYLNIQVIASLAHELYRRKKTNLPEDKRYALMHSLWNYKQGRYKDVSVEENVLLLFPMSDFSYLKKGKNKIQVIEQKSGNSYNIFAEDPLYKCASEAFCRKKLAVP